MTTFYSPTKLIFGKDAEFETGKLAKQFGAKKVLLHYGGKSAKSSGVLDRVRKALEKESLEVVELGGVQPNPRLSLVREGEKICRSQNIDFIVAVGGGSVIDSAKAIALASKNDADVWDFYSRKSTPQSALALGCVLTLPAAGSEMSNSSVITKDEGMLKRGFTSDLIMCKFAVMNPELTYTLSDYQTQCGCADIMMHTMERYFCTENFRPIIDGFAETLMKNLMFSAQKVRNFPKDYDTRSQIMWAGTMSHNNITGHRNLGDWACHQIEHELSGMFDVPHGAGLTAVWSSWARYVYKNDIPRFAQFAVNVFDCHNNFKDQESVALAGIEAFERFFSNQGMPINIKQLGISLTEEQIKELAYKCSFENTRTVGCVKKLNMQDMEAIYRNASI